MEKTDISDLRQWVANYCGSFHSADRDIQQNILLKEKHISMVAANMLALSADLRLDENQTMLAEAVGLLHDIGRFPQFAKYRTFRDSISVNHGSLGADVIEQEKPMANIPADELQMIIDSVRFHNAFAIPAGIAPETEFFLRMIRDSDKLDIWRICMEFFETPEEERDSAAGLGLPDLPGYSEKVLASLAAGKLATLADLKTLNDFKLMQLTWIYDLNFPASFSLAIEHGHLSRIIATLPETARISNAVRLVSEHMQAKAFKRSISC